MTQLMSTRSPSPLTKDKHAVPSAAPAASSKSPLHLLTGQCALILGEAIEFVVDVKEALQETAEFTLALGLELRLE